MTCSANGAPISRPCRLGRRASTLPTGENIANLDFGFRLSGDDPAWRPLRVYTDGAKDLHPVSARLGIRSGPALVALDNGRQLVFAAAAADGELPDARATATSWIASSTGLSWSPGSAAIRPAWSSPGTERDDQPHA